jgi:hypothetical protein
VNIDDFPQLEFAAFSMEADMTLASPQKHLLISSRRILHSGLAIALLTVTFTLAATRSFRLNTNAVSPTLSTTSLPLAFEANHGQAQEEVVFQARGYGGGSLRFLPQQVNWSLPAAWQGQSGLPPDLQLQFHGAQAAPEISGGKQLPGITNYLIGDDPMNWLTNIPTYEDIVYEQLYLGIDLQYTGRQTVDGQWSLKGTYIT